MQKELIMNFLIKLFSSKKDKNIKSETNILNSNKRNESFIQSCLENKYQELEDNRWFSDFEELPKIDQYKNNGEYRKALDICLKGLKTHYDSFLFYGRAADLYDLLNKPQEAIKILNIGLEKSLCKSSIAKYIADRAFRRNDYREAIFWWIQAVVMQFESNLLVEYVPFLNLAYLCKATKWKEEEEWCFSMVDKISPQGPIRFDSIGAKLRYDLILKAKKNGDNDVLDSIKLLFKKYN